MRLDRRWTIALTIGLSALWIEPSGLHAASAASAKTVGTTLGLDVGPMPEPASVLVALAGLGMLMGRPKPQRRSD